MEPTFTHLPTAKSFSIWFDLAHLPGRDRPDMAVSLQTDIYFATYVACESPGQDATCPAGGTTSNSFMIKFAYEFEH